MKKCWHVLGSKLIFEINSDVLHVINPDTNSWLNVWKWDLGIISYYRKKISKEKALKRQLFSSELWKLKLSKQFFSFGILPLLSNCLRWKRKKCQFYLLVPADHHGTAWLLIPLFLLAVWSFRPAVIHCSNFDLWHPTDSLTGNWLWRVWGTDRWTHQVAWYWQL